MNLINIIHSNFVQTSLLNVKEVIKTDHCLAVLTDYEDAYYNGVISTANLGENINSEIDLILFKFKDKKSEITWYVNEELDPEDLKSALLKNNFTKQDIFDGIALKLNSYNHKDFILPDGYRIEKIDKIEKLADWYIPFNKVFELSDEDRQN